MIKSVGIDPAGAGEHKVRCLDEEAQLCDGFGFETTPEGLSKLESVFSETGLIRSLSLSLPVWRGSW
jgi:hypothetical protein